jgi:site-specific DNA-methyltransferase (adenine-specific)
MGLKSVDLSEYVPNGRWPANLIHDGSTEVLEVFARFGDHKGAPLSARGRGKKGASKHINIGGGQINCVYGDDGSAARFFYCAKANKNERTIGGVVKNEHPTVKPIALLRYLCRLIARKNGLVLDPFIGSGSTALACLLEGFSCIGIDQSKRYLAIASRRITAFLEG